MEATIAGRVQTFLVLAGAPWVCGYCLALALTLAKALLATRALEGPLDLRVHGMVWVATRSHVVGALFAAAVLAAALAVAVSRGIGGAL